MAPRSTLHNAAFTMVGQLTARVLALVFYAVLARAVGPARYGDQGFGVAVGTLFVTLLEPGLNMLLIRDGARSRADLEERLAESLGYKLSLLAVAWPLSVVICAALGYHAEALWAVALAGGGILLGAIEDVAASALIAVERLDVEGLLRTLSKVLTAGSGLLALAFGADFVVVLGASCAGSALAGLLALSLVRRSGVHVHLRLSPVAALRRVLASWPLAVTVVLWLLTLRLDQFLASVMGVEHDELGNYNAAVKVVEALILFPNAIATAFQPVISRAWPQGPRECSQPLSQAMAAAMALSLAIAAGGAVLSPGICGLIYGDRFQTAPTLLAVQLFALPLVGLQFISMHTLVAAGAVRQQAIAVAVNFAVNIVCNVVLVPRLGVMGATISAVAGGVAAVGVFLVSLHRLGLSAGLWSAVWRPGVAGALMVAAVLAVRDHVPLLVAIGVGGVVYGAVLWAVGGMNAVLALRRARSTAA
ncbi:MAG: oligosaccharide flippase family protein [Myxococcota bacterium]